MVDVDRRLALVALWAVFAAAAVGVGFGAAGLVSDPLTDRSAGAAGPVAPVGDLPTPTATGSSSPSSTPGPTGSTDVSPTPDDGAGAGAVRRSLSTRGGLVSAVCRLGLVRLSASPAVGWGIDDIDRRFTREARVRFEGGGEDESRVEVRTSCVGGVPRFVLEDDR